MARLLNIFKKFVVIILCLIIIPWLYYYVFAYKNLIFSFMAKNGIKGKIVYSLLTSSDIDVKLFDFATGKKFDIYKTIPREQEGYFGYVNSFSFSREGNKIVLSKMNYMEKNHNFKLYTMNIDGTGLTELLDIEGMNLEHPVWSPDGRKVAFIVQKPYGQGGLYVVDVDKPYSTVKMISNIRPASRRLHWSPDGQEISFISDEYIQKRINARWRSETFDGKTFVVNDSGTDLWQFKSKNPVSWSPNGRMLLYMDEDGYYLSNENQSQRYLIIPYKRAPLSLLVEDPSFAVWSPDGKYIAYVKENWPGGAGLGIYVISLDNPAKEIQITTEIYGITEMVWVK